MPTKVAKWKSFTFMYKDSTQVVARLKAVTYSQAIFRLKLRLGTPWVVNALDTGLIHLGSIEPAKAPITKAQKNKAANDRFEDLKSRGALWYTQD
jgi:hypothetical protein